MSYRRRRDAHGTPVRRLWRSGPLWGALLVGVLLAGADVSGCKKARGDDFDRFRPSEHLETAGAGARATLRYRPVPGADAIYQLKVWRRSSLHATRARMHLRLALHLEDASEGAPFVLRLLTVLALVPEPEGDGLDLGPAHRVLAGHLGPRGGLDRLEASSDLPAPVNLVLLAPLLLPYYPLKAVGPGARWRVRRRVTWRRSQSHDALVRRPRFSGHTDVLLDRRYGLQRYETAGERGLARLALTVNGRLRGRVETLGHQAAQRGTVKGTGTVVVERATGLPEQLTLSLQGSYGLQTDDLSQQVTERVGITLQRERE